MKNIKIAGKATLADIQRYIDNIEEQLEQLSTKYPDKPFRYAPHEDKEDSFW